MAVAPDRIRYSAAELRDLYAGYAQALRYPHNDDGLLTGVEFLAAFDPSLNEEAASLHEASYVDIERSTLFEELVRFYEYFGLARKPDAALPDHLAIEMEFMHFLCERERRSAGDRDALGSLHNAQRDFLDRHVRRLLQGLMQRFDASGSRAGELVRSCSDFVETHRRWLG